MSYKFFNGEKNFYLGFNEINGNFHSMGQTFTDGGMLQIRFKCPKCNWVMTAEGIYVVTPPVEEESVSGDFVICQRCNAEYQIDIFSSYRGNSILIPELPNNWKFYYRVESTPSPEEYGQT
jgi:hypothetical protein